LMGAVAVDVLVAKVGRVEVWAGVCWVILKVAL